MTKKKKYEPKYKYNTDLGFCYDRVKGFLVNRCSIVTSTDPNLVDPIRETYNEFLDYCQSDLKLDAPDVSIIMMGNVLDTLSGIRRLNGFYKGRNVNGYIGFTLNQNIHNYSDTENPTPFTYELVDMLREKKKEDDRLALQDLIAKREKESAEEDAKIDVERQRKEEADKKAHEEEIRKEIEYEYLKKSEADNEIKYFGFAGKPFNSPCTRNQSNHSHAKPDVDKKPSIIDDFIDCIKHDDDKCHHDKVFDGTFKAIGATVNGVQIITCAKCGKYWELKNTKVATRSTCSHRNQDGSFNLIYRAGDPNHLKCGICGEEFNFKPAFTNEDVVCATNEIINIIQSIKLLYPGSAEVFKENPLMIEALKSVPFLYGEALRLHYENYGTYPANNRL